MTQLVSSSTTDRKTWKGKVKDMKHEPAKPNILSWLKTNTWKWQCLYCRSFALSLMQAQWHMILHGPKKTVHLVPSALGASDHKDWPSSCITVYMQYFPASVTKFDRKSRPWTLICTWCSYSSGPRQKCRADHTNILQRVRVLFWICCFF